MSDWTAEIRRRLEPLGLAPWREAEIVEELAQHLDDRYRELIGTGATPEAAADATRQELLSDHALAEALRATEPPRASTPVLGHAATGGLLASLAVDLRYGFRSLRQSPGLAAVALLTLGLGIGANAAIFSVVNAVLLRPLPFREPERLVAFWGTAPDKGLPVVDYPDALYAYYRQRARSVDPLAMYTLAGFTLTGGREPERLAGVNVTVDFFRLLGVVPLHGRTFLPSEEAPNNNRVVVLSHGLWRRRFAADPGIVGRAVILNDIPTTVVGVMPRGFDFPQRAELWIPLPIEPQSINCWCYDAVGRLGPGRTPGDLQREIDALNADFWADREGRPRASSSGPRAGTVVTPLARRLVGEVRTPVLVLLGAVGMVLLIACANLANLLLSRATERSRELAVRAALGASPSRIARQLLAESALLAAAGAVLGLGLARLGVVVLGRAAVERVSHLDRVHLDLVVVGFTVLLTVATALLFGVAPATRGARIQLVDALKEGARGSSDRSSRRLNDAFAIGQLALSLVLLVGSGLLLRSFAKLLAVDPGFQAENVLVGRVALPWTIYREMPQVRELYDRLAGRVAGLPGVTHVGLSSTAPFSNNNNQQELVVRGHEPSEGEAVPVTSVRRVTPGYFEAVGTPLRQGRSFSELDRDSSNLVAVVDETLAHRYWPKGSAVGGQISVGDPRDRPTWRTIVGVAASIQHGSLVKPPDHYVYLPLSQSFAWTMDLVVRASSRPAALIPALRAEVRAIDPNLPLYEVHTLDQAIGQSLSTRRMTNLLLLGFAAAALLLAAIGVYGVMARNVAARVREFGVRLALGATPAEVRALVLRRAMRLVLLGVVIGGAGAAGITQLLRALLFEVKPLDPLTFATAPALLGLVALGACYLPARRATAVDPLEAIRAE
jgi:predicted permease